MKYLVWYSNNHYKKDQVITYLKTPWGSTFLGGCICTEILFSQWDNIMQTLTVISQRKVCQNVKQKSGGYKWSAAVLMLQYLTSKKTKQKQTI